MSAILTPCGENIIQVTAWSEGDTYTHIRAGNLQQPGISCDTAADLPAQAGGLSGYYLEQDSCAHVIEGNQLYCITSAGVWVLQETSPYKDIYTKTQIDTMFDSVNTAIGDTIGFVSKQVDVGAKNMLNVFAVTTPQIINDITWTINADGTVTATAQQQQTVFCI